MQYRMNLAILVLWLGLSFSSSSLHTHHLKGNKNDTYFVQMLHENWVSKVVSLRTYIIMACVLYLIRNKSVLTFMIKLL